MGRGSEKTEIKIEKDRTGYEMKIGLLPLYVKLYDDKLPELRIRLEKFYGEIVKMFEGRNITVLTSDFCRVADEFQSAVGRFERENADAIVTLHMAYSPSLESIDALSGTKLPLIVLDTTQTLEFTNEQNPDEIMYCHGVHGVMDMCAMLTRRGKRYAIAAGHYKESDVVERACGYIRAAVSAKSLPASRVGLIGGDFEGMGDFQVPDDELKNRFGIEVLRLSAAEMSGYYETITENETECERQENREKYLMNDNVIPEEYDKSLKSCLAVRKCVKAKRLNALSVNFSRMGKESGLPSMPFLECCKSMERGIGYAGEGDVLTASFVGALLQGYPEATFVEIFCPDWKNNLVFLSHMGEMNYRIAGCTPEITRAGVNYSPGEFPYAGYSRMKGGKGVFLNISRGKDDYKLLLSAAEMVSYDDDNFSGAIRGWMATGGTCADFLRDLSVNGATHHSIFVYGGEVQSLRYFGELLGLETVVIGEG